MPKTPDPVALAVWAKRSAKKYTDSVVASGGSATSSAISPSTSVQNIAGGKFLAVTADGTHIEGVAAPTGGGDSVVISEDQDFEGTAAEIMAYLATFSDKIVNANVNIKVTAPPSANLVTVLADVMGAGQFNFDDDGQNIRLAETFIIQNCQCSVNGYGPVGDVFIQNCGGFNWDNQESADGSAQFQSLAIGACNAVLGGDMGLNITGTLAANPDANILMAAGATASDLIVTESATVTIGKYANAAAIDNQGGVIIDNRVNNPMDTFSRKGASGGSEGGGTELFTTDNGDFPWPSAGMNINFDADDNWIDFQFESGSYTIYTTVRWFNLYDGTLKTFSNAAGGDNFQFSVPNANIPHYFEINAIADMNNEDVAPAMISMKGYFLVGAHKWNVAIETK